MGSGEGLDGVDAVGLKREQDHAVEAEVGDIPEDVLVVIVVYYRGSNT